MRKFLVAILALTYISTSSGANLHMHYCMGKLAGWGFMPNESKTCSKCGMTRSDKKINGCCKDKHSYLKNSSDQKVTESTIQQPEPIVVSLPASYIDIPVNDLHIVTEEIPGSHDPPRMSGPVVYIRNCVFLI